jgi:cytochrome c553
MVVHPRLAACFAFVVAAVPAMLSAQTASNDEAKRIEFFETKVRPVLANNCYNCHSADTNSQGGLRVDDRNGLLMGGNRGPAVVPGQPEKSLLIQAVSHTHPKLKMPPNKHLSEQQIADLTQWIKDGAVWPKVELPASIEVPVAKYEKLKKKHWAFQLLTAIKVPTVKNAAWPLADIDRFILAGLEKKGLMPVGDADRVTLLRRVTFDLIGLPPTPQEIDAFLADTSADAFEKVVDRLLASPQFGERWGRHWLDVARYGESTGPSRNIPYPHAWRYRDYVINAFNIDKPYDQFLREQLAGDLLPWASQKQRDEQLIATGFLALGPRDVNQRFKVRFVMDNIAEEIDTLGRALLGLTVSCARCHNHKFEPIPTMDYYALAGIFHSTEVCAGVRNKMGGGGLDYYDPMLFLPLGSGDSLYPESAVKFEQTKKELAQANAAVAALKSKPAAKELDPDGRPKLESAQEKVKELQKQLQALSDPAAIGPVAQGVRDAKVIGDTEIRIRGEAEKLGPVVARGFLSLFKVPSAAAINPKQSGRLELAHWLCSDQNPLPARVMANRVWYHLFGQGLVSTVDNFGVSGAAPSHPELLDYMATRFVEGGWSVKKLVRLLVLSRAYRLSGEAPAGHVAVDPDNRLVWRHSPRRLDAEEIRDAMLAASGLLDLTRPVGSLAMDLKIIELTDNTPLAKGLLDKAQKSVHRSVYLPLVRTLTPKSLEVFDFAEQGMVTGNRDTTTVATQALYMLNDPFVQQQALALAKRLLAPAEASDTDRLKVAFLLTMGRAATAKEIDKAKKYLAAYEAAAGKLDKGVAVEAANPKTAAWASFCQALLASAEFRFIR